MKRILCFVLTLAMLCSITLPVLSLQAATSEAPAMSVEKTAFATGETIKVKLDCLPDTLPAKTYVILYPRSYVVGGTPNGTWVKITDDDGTHLYNEGDTIDVVKKDALTGTDFSLILVAPYASGRPLYQQIDITIGKPAMSVKKTDFAGGETIKVQLDCLPDTLPAKTYVILYPRSYVVGGTPNGTWVKITDDDGTHLYNEGDTIDVVKKDALTGTDFSLILVAPYASGQPLYQQIDITIGKPTLSMEKTEFAVGEDIAVTYNNVAESLLTGKSWVTVAIFKKGDVVGTHTSTAEHRVWHTDASKEQSKQPSATISFPDDDNGRNGEHFPLPVGEYYVCIRQDNTVVGEPIPFKVVPAAPEISVGKTQYEMGEKIEISYANVDEYYLTTSTGGYVTVAVFKKGDAPGKQSAQLEHRVWHTTAANASKLSAATITFPDAYTGSGTAVFPLPAGEYYACVRQGSSTVLARAEFTVTEGAICVAQPEIKDAITMHYTALVSDSLSDVKMKFIFDGEEVFVAGIAKGTKNHCTTYTFALSNILPQQMGCNIRAELYAGDTLIDSHDDYSVKQYCLNQLAQTADEDTELRALLVAMLNYGTEAQKYFESAVDGFVNEGVDQSYLTNQDIANAQGVIANPISGDNTGDYVWKAATLGLYDEIKIRVKFYATSVENLKVLANDVAYTEFVRAGTDLYYVYIPVMASEFANSLTIEFDCGEAVGAVLTYSVNTYIQYAANNGTADVQAIIQAIYNYGMAAKAYADTL